MPDQFVLGETNSVLLQKVYALINLLKEKLLNSETYFALKCYKWDYISGLLS